MSSVLAATSFNSLSVRRSYLTVRALNADMVTYDMFSQRTQVNSQLQTVGELTPTAVIAKGTLLRENGTKLQPGVNPGVSTQLVGVFTETFPSVSGQIDPNSPAFTLFHGDKPPTVERSTDPDGDLLDKGMSIYTNGTVEAAGTITSHSSIHADASITAGSNITAGTQVNGAQQSLSSQPGGGSNINFQVAGSKGNVFSLNMNGMLGSSNTAFTQFTATTSNLSLQVPPAGSFVTLLVTGDNANQFLSFANDSNIYSTAPAQAIDANTKHTFSFVSDGSKVWQTAAAQTLS